MGAWGYGIFDDDDAADVRDDWIEHYKFTASSAKATEAVLKEHGSGIDDKDTGPVIILALALTLWKHGCLTNEWREKALRVIDDGLGLDLWKEQGPKEVAKHQKHRDKARARLISPQPPSREGKFKPKKLVDCGLRVGDVFSVPVSQGSKERGYFRVVALARSVGKIEPVVQMLNVPLLATPDEVHWEECEVVGIRDYTTLGCNSRMSYAQMWDKWPKGYEKIIQIHRCGGDPESDGTMPKAGCNYIAWAGLGNHVVPSHDQSRWLNSDEFEKMLLHWTLEEIAEKIPWFKAECAKREWESDKYLYQAARDLARVYAQYEKSLAMIEHARSWDVYSSYHQVRAMALYGLGRIEEAQAEWDLCMKLSEPFKVLFQKMPADIAEAKNIIESHRKAAEFYKSRPDLKQPDG